MEQDCVAVAPLTPLGDTEIHDLPSPTVGETFRIFLGRCGAQPAATLVLTDANGLFGVAVDTIRMMQLPALLPDLLVVGIGYPDAATIGDTLISRARDLTPTPSHHFPGSGGADAFLGFIRDELLPWVGPPAGPRIYFGHSLGGLFGTYALFAEPAVFDSLIISSPSLWWDHHTPFTWPAARDDLTARAYFGIGALETDDGRRLEGTNLPEGHPFKPVATYLDMVDDLRRFTAAVQERSFPNLETAVEVFPDEFHATVAPTVLNRGLRWLLGPA